MNKLCNDCGFDMEGPGQRCDFCTGHAEGVDELNKKIKDLKSQNQTHVDALNDKIRVLKQQKLQLRGILDAMLDSYSCSKHEEQMRKMRLSEMQELFPDKCVMCEQETHKAVRDCIERLVSAGTSFLKLVED